jgi:hypothetical protein
MEPSTDPETCFVDVRLYVSLSLYVCMCLCRCPSVDVVGLQGLRSVAMRLCDLACVCFAHANRRATGAVAAERRRYLPQAALAECVCK